MREAEITCLCSEICFRDLDLSMTKGEIKWIDEADARSSADLNRFATMGAVRLEYKERFRSRPQPASSLPARSWNPPKKDSFPLKELEKRFESLEKSVAEIRKIVLDIRGSIISGFERTQVLLSQQRVLPQVSGKEEKEVENFEEEQEEVFIPSSLLIHKTERVEFPERVVSEEGLDESARLLKSLKQKKSGE